MKSTSQLRFPVKDRVVGALIIAFFASISFACGYTNDVSDAEREVALFRDRVKNQEFEKIWIESSSKFKDAMTYEDFLNFMGDLPTEIDATHTMQKHDSTVGWDPAHGKYVILRYRPIETGRLDMEHFLFTSEQEKWRLSGYHVTENR